MPLGFSHLQDSHRVIRGLLRQLEAINLRGGTLWSAVAAELKMEVEITFDAEDEILLPFLESETPEIDETAHAQYFTCRKSHEEVRELLSGFDRQGKPRSALEDLSEGIDFALSQEEREVFPRLEKISSLVLENISNEMEKRRAELMAQPKYQDALPWRVQNTRGGEQMRKRAS